jgi:hypothetical protein
MRRSVRATSGATVRGRLQPARMDHRGMQNPRNYDDRSMNPPELEGEAKANELAGREQPDEKDPVFDVSDVDSETGGVTGQMLYEGEMGEIGGDDLVRDEDRLELLEDRELRSGETNDPYLAAEEGLAYVPPSDPPVVASSDPQGAVVAAGFGSSSLDEPFDAEHHSSALPDEDEMTARVREAILADSATTQYAETIEIETEGGEVTLRGIVDDIEDADNLAAVASTVTGVAEVTDRTRVRNA